MKRENIATNGLDRSSLHRSDKSWILDKFNDEQTRIIPVHNLTVLCDNTKQPKGVYLTLKDFVKPLDIVDSMIFLGFYDEMPYFAADINSDELASNLIKQKNAVFQDLQSVISLLDDRDCELLTISRFMIFWHLRNQYCGKCGNKTKSSDSGHVRICQNKACKEHYFPSMDPAVIVLVTYGDRCLLGRKKEWLEGMYSTLAGFVEPGETIEDAVVREVREEAGIIINLDDVKYQHSQPWLSPSSLMLGFTAKAKGKEIILDKKELDDACWFTRDEIKLNPRIVPFKVSIAYKLINEWLNKGD
ncbi:MAG: NAD(+) diphosphatase [Desulfobacteraceae bacterium]|jgi:NAD+ diphosphatase|nr:NAD(+) diphosphatase [Desulfobacteraceae bacterium]